jgi:class 3 adenylate cyclase
MNAKDKDNLPKTRVGYVDTLITGAFPVLSIPTRAWRIGWKQRDQKEFTVVARFYFLAFALAYIVHLFAIDIPLKKQPPEWWEFYRGSCSLAYLIGFSLTFSKKFNESKIQRIPLLLAAIYGVYMQGRSMEFNSDIPVFYVPLIALFGALALRFGPIVSVGVYLLILAPSNRFFYLVQSQTHHMVSATCVAIAVLLFLRSRQKTEISLFLAEQEKVEYQKKLIELQTQLVDQLKSFLPKQIHRRMDKLLSSGKRSALEVVDELLRPKEIKGAVLFTDIRGFTGLTKSGRDAVLSAIVPAQRLCTDVIENAGGIPRLQGDLVYAYFDDVDATKNIRTATAAAISLYESTKILNETLRSDFRIRRYVIITYGELIVGNLGGTEGSRDITVLGDAANLPSRIDPLTKDVGLSKLLEQYPIILSQFAFDALDIDKNELEYTSVLLKDYNLKIRDFEEITELKALKSTEKNLALLTQSNVAAVSGRDQRERFSA